MKNRESGFSAIEGILIVIMIGSISLLGWYILSNSETTVTKQNTVSNSGDCYDVNGSTFIENSPPAKDRLDIRVDKNKDAQFKLSFAEDNNSHKFNYNGICTIDENLNGAVAKTIEFHLQKIKQNTKATATTGLNIKIGSPKEFSSPFKTEGDYLVKVIINTIDESTNKSINIETLTGSIKYL